MSPPVDVETLFAAGAERPEGLVSVVVSLFDYGRHIAECLDCVAAQDHRALELIVVDDASTDDSAERARLWMDGARDRFARVLLLRHRANQGLAGARNTGFARAGADPVLVLDADNGLFPRAVGRLLECLEDSGAAAAYSQTAFFEGAEGPGYGDVWSPERFRRANYVDAMALVSKRAWARVGGYVHLEQGWEDFDFWCRFVEAGLHGVFVPEMLCRYRVHAASMLRTRTDPGRAGVVAELMYRHPWLDLDD